VIWVIAFALIGSALGDGVFVIMMFWIVIVVILGIPVILANVFGLGAGLLEEGNKNKASFDTDMGNMQAQLKQEYEEQVAQINCMVVEDLTDKEKVAYLRSIGRLTKSVEESSEIVGVITNNSVTIEEDSLVSDIVNNTSDDEDYKID